MDYKKEDKELKRGEKQGDVTESVQIPVGSADVKEMIAQNLYADKTAYITKLFRTNGIYYFFIRPRRFGKSLLLDTIDQIAQGNKELFKDCSIYNNKAYKWKKHPVIRLNFSELSSKEPDLLEEDLKKYFYRVAETYNIKDKMPQPTGKDSIQSYFLDLFNYLINFPDDRSYERQPIVLIDEYDSPLISCEKEQYEDMLIVLISFFKVLKGRQKDCKFVFVTGVTKFHLSGLTSGANSANDISLHEDYAEMLGYTEEDIDSLFFNNK